MQRGKQPTWLAVPLIPTVLLSLPLVTTSTPHGPMDISRDPGLRLSGPWEWLCGCLTWQPWSPGVVGCLSASLPHPNQRANETMGCSLTVFWGMSLGLLEAPWIPQVCWPHRAHPGHGGSFQVWTLGINLPQGLFPPGITKPTGEAFPGLT